MSTHSLVAIKTKQGFSLIECLLVMVISIIILTALTSLYISSQRTQQSKLIHLQNNATTAIKLLTGAIQQAGRIGCARLQPGFPLKAYGSLNLTADNKITGNEQEIIVRYIDYPNATLLQDMQNDNNLTTSNQTLFKKDELLIISDCSKAEIFKVKYVQNNVNSQIITTNLHNRFGSGAELGKFIEYHFYVSNTTRRNSVGRPISALFVKDIKQNSYELVEGISALHISYHRSVTTNQLLGVEIKITVTAPPLKQNWYAYAGVT